MAIVTLAYSDTLARDKWCHCRRAHLYLPAPITNNNNEKCPFTFDSFLEIVLRPKMNCTVRFSKQFSESSPCLPGQQGTGQQGWYASGTLRKQFTKPHV